jgi:hypothetical protein
LTENRERRQRQRPKSGTRIDMHISPGPPPTAATCETICRRITFCRLRGPLGFDEAGHSSTRDDGPGRTRTC